MIEALMSLVTSALTLMWPFYWPLLVAFGFRVMFDVLWVDMVPEGGARVRGVLLSAAVAVLGAVAVVCALVPGVFAYSVSRLVIPGSASGGLVLDLMAAGGTWRLGALLVVTALALGLFGAGMGALLWLWFGKWMPRMPLRQWIRESSVLLVAGFIGSVFETLVIAAVLPGPDPAFLLGLGGFVTGLAAGKWVRDITWEFEVEQAVVTV
jgi:hypothetical protein